MIFFFKFIFLIVPVLLSVAFITLLERKLLSLVGFRLGPNKVSFGGIFQPITDALKLMNKQNNSLSNFSWFFYYFSSFLVIMGSLILFLSIFIEPQPISLKYGMLFFFLVLGLNSFNSIICGWSVFSKYSLIGSVRTTSQLISYEAVLYMVLFFFFFCLKTFSFEEFFFNPLNFFFFIIPVCFYIWVPSFLAELNRTPYDFSEGESELVSGFNTEFGSLSFTLIFLGEYGNIIFFSLISGMMFFLNFISFFFFFFFIIWIRSVLPRFRFDKLMDLAWKFFIPFLTFFFFFYVSFSF